MTDKVYQFLFKPMRIRGKIIQIQSQIEGIKLSILPSAITYDRDKVQTSTSSCVDSMAEYIAKLNTLELHLTSLYQQYMQAQEDIVNATKKLPPNEYGAVILQRRYISSVDFGTIASEISMSERQMFRYYRKACDSLDAILKDVSECQ